MRRTIRKPDDFHVHFRLGQMLEDVVGWTSSCSLVMPNTKPAILTWKEAQKYRDQILKLTEKDEFYPLMSLYLTEDTEAGDLLVAQRKANVVAGKLYLKGGTHNSELGVSDLSKMKTCFSAMQDLGLVLCIHGESPDTYCMQAETAFLPKLIEIANEFPRLRIVLEHITTEAAVRTVESLPSCVGATITPHHLATTTDDVLRGKLRPHNYCMPIQKSPIDRLVLREATMSGNPKFFLGTDSAPHLRRDKECPQGCAGVFNAPCALPLLAELFEERGNLDALEFFTSVAGANFYKLALNKGTISLDNRLCEIPGEISGIVPFMAKKTIAYSVSR